MVVWSWSQRSTEVVRVLRLLNVCKKSSWESINNRWDIVFILDQSDGLTNTNIPYTRTTLLAWLKTCRVPIYWWVVACWVISFPLSLRPFPLPLLAVDEWNWADFHPSTKCLQSSLPLPHLNRHLLLTTTLRTPCPSFHENNLPRLYCNVRSIATVFLPNCLFMTSASDVCFGSHDIHY